MTTGEMSRSCCTKAASPCLLGHRAAGLLGVLSCSIASLAGNLVPPVYPSAGDSSVSQWGMWVKPHSWENQQHTAWVRPEQGKQLVMRGAFSYAFCGGGDEKFQQDGTRPEYFSPSACLEQRGCTKCLCCAKGCPKEIEIWAPTGDGNEGLIQHLPFLSVCFFHWGGQVFWVLPHWKQNYAPHA